MGRYRTDYVKRSRRRRGTGKNIFGTIAMLLALVLIFFAGAIVGRVQANRNAPGTASQPVQNPPPAVSSGTQQPEPPGIPDGVETAKREENHGLAGMDQILPIDQVTCNYIVIDRATGEIILQKGAQDRVYPASTTKIMTAALALDLQQDLKTQMTVQQMALSILSYDASKIGLLVGEQLSFQDLLYGMMLPSGCDAANVIAQNAAADGNLNTFVKQMNQKAKDIGCDTTYFVNPSGIHSTSHFSTVSDLARIETYAQRNSIYQKIVGSQDYNMATTNLHNAAGWNILHNSNQLLGHESLFSKSGNIIQINGSKTGSTVGGGYSLVCTAVTKDGVELVAVIAGIPYENGRGIYKRAAYMSAVLEEAGRLTAAREKTPVVTAGSDLSSVLPEGVRKAIPQNAQVVAERGFAYLEQTELRLTNGSTPIFISDKSFQQTVTLYDDFSQAVSQFDPGEEKNIGYLTVANQAKELSIQIPLILKAAS